MPALAAHHQAGKRPDRPVVGTGNQCASEHACRCALGGLHGRYRRHHLAGRGGHDQVSPGRGGLRRQPCRCHAVHCRGHCAARAAPAGAAGNAGHCRGFQSQGSTGAIHRTARRKRCTFHRANAGCNPRHRSTNRTSFSCYPAHTRNRHLRQHAHRRRSEPADRRLWKYRNRG
nr:hypothetical protein [Xanthomonas arboricola]